MIHSCPIFILLTCSIPVVSMYMYFQWYNKKVWILIRWLRQCFQKKINLGSAGQLVQIHNVHVSLFSLTDLDKGWPDEIHLLFWILQKNTHKKQKKQKKNIYLTLCMLGNFAQASIFVCYIFTFFKIISRILSECIICSLDPDKASHSKK